MVEITNRNMTIGYEVLFWYRY